MCYPQGVTDTHNNSPYGRNFTRALARSGLRPADLMDATGVGNSSVISNWKARGVPGEYAHLVGELLQVDPTRISRMAHEAQRQHLQYVHEEAAELKRALRSVERAMGDAEHPAEAERLGAQRDQLADRIATLAAMLEANVVPETVTGVPQPGRVSEPPTGYRALRGEAPGHYRRQRLHEIVDENPLSPRDQDLIEALIARLSRK